MRLADRIELVRVENVNDLPGLDLPWAQHHVKAILDGVEIGVMRIKYVPREAYEAYPDKEELAERYYGSRDDVAGWEREHVDQPVIDFANVRHEHHRRSGVGTALYLESARWMKELGLPICSFTRSQSADAVAIWGFLKQNYKTHEKGEGDERKICLCV